MCTDYRYYMYYSNLRRKRDDERHRFNRRPLPVPIGSAVDRARRDVLARGKIDQRDEIYRRKTKKKKKKQNKNKRKRKNKRKNATPRNAALPYKLDTDRVRVRSRFFLD